MRRSMHMGKCPSGTEMRNAETGCTDMGCTDMGCTHMGSAEVRRRMPSASGRVPSSGMTGGLGSKACPGRET